MADKLLELYSKMPKGYFKDEEEFKTYASDPANYDDIFDIVKDSGDFTSKEEMVSYISPDVKKKKIQIQDSQVENHSYHHRLKPQSFLKRLLSLLGRNK